MVVEVRRPDRIAFRSFDGRGSLRVGQGDHCVVLMIRGAHSAGIVLTDTEADDLALSLKRRVRFSRESPSLPDTEESPE